MHLLPYLPLLLIATLKARAANDAGIGAEFESIGFTFENSRCSNEDTNAAKKEVVDNRRHDTWYLSADTGSGQGKLNAEYILDGEKIKVGTGDAAKIGKAVANDLIEWSPWIDDPKTVDISNNKCNPWRIASPNRKTDKAENVPWFPQITTSMPLEALYSLMKENIADPDKGRNKLNGDSARYSGGKLIALVTEEHFQSQPNGIDGSKVGDDVLGFLTLVLSYAKAAKEGLRPDQSPKLFIPFMPRTEFNTIYQQVSSQLCGDLFELFRVLACYKRVGKGLDSGLMLDTDYCSGPLEKPVPNDKFGALTYENIGANPHARVNIKEWIQGIGELAPIPDKLSDFDRSIDGSIGGLGTKMEKIYNSDREAPIFEFRDLFDIKTSDFGQWMSDVDSAIQKLHNDFANAPNKLKRADNCQAPKPTTTTAPAVKCYHAASPRHTCAAIANDGWCDCGDSNKYQKMTEPGSVCEWTTLPPTKSYDCPAATTMVTTTSAPATTTTAPPPPPVPSCPVDKYPQCDKCPGGWNVDKCVATEASAACRCNDPCGDITCLFS